MSTLLYSVGGGNTRRKGERGGGENRRGKQTGKQTGKTDGERGMRKENEKGGRRSTKIDIFFATTGGQFRSTVTVRDGRQGACTGLDFCNKRRMANGGARMQCRYYSVPIIYLIFRKGCDRGACRRCESVRVFK